MAIGAQASGRRRKQTGRMVLGPEWLAHRYDEATDQIRFVEYDRATRASVPFLTDQYLPAKPYKALRRNEALAMATMDAKLHCIFHSGFCCSTLLASCFDQPGLATAFSEPMILNDVVGWRNRGATPAAVGTLLNDALTLLSRPFAGDPVALIKPSTLLNGLAPAMMRLRPQARAILIHAPLRDFLISIAKKGIDGRLWARTLFLSMRREGLTRSLGFDDEAFFGQTDLQIAACAWLGQQAAFAALAEQHADRIRTIDSVQFLDQPEATIRKVAELFGLSLADEAVAAALAGPLQRNSKDRSSFSREERESEYSRALDLHGDEIRKVEVWPTEVAKATAIRLQLPAPLL
jgi:hypothetical protein